MRDSFVFHTSQREYLRMLPKDDQIRIYDFLTDFAESDGTIPLPDNLDKSSFIVLKMITDRMRDDFAKYDEIRQKRAEGGKLGGRPKKPKGLTENHKVSEKPQGYFENLTKAKKPVSVSVSDSVSDSECVCDSEGEFEREGTDTHTATRDQIEAEYKAICKKYGVSVRVGFIDRFLRCRHRDWRADIEQWVSEDIRRGEYKKPATRFSNYEQSGTDWNAVADLIIQQQEQEQEMESLAFE